MARLFTSGFETNEGTTGVAEWSAISNPTNTTFDTVHVRSGTYAGKVVSTGGTEYWLRMLAAAVTSGTYFVRFYEYFVTLPNMTNAAGFLFRWASSSDANGGMLRVLSDGTIILTNNADSSAITSAPGVIVAGTWQRIEVMLKVLTAGDGAVDIELLVDGVSIGTLTNKITVSTNLQRFMWGLSSTGSSGTIWFDDIAINDATGLFQNTWPGDGSIVLLEPTGDVAVSWSKLGGTPAPTNWQGIDDLPGTINDSIDFNSDANTTNVDRLAFTAVPAGVTPVLLDVYGRVGGDGTTARSMIFCLWDEAGASMDGPTINVNIAAWKIVSTAEHFVVDVTAETPTNLNSWNVGYKGNSGSSRNKRITALWLNFEYQVPGGAMIATIASAASTSASLTGAGILSASIAGAAAVTPVIGANGLLASTIAAIAGVAGDLTGLVPSGAMIATISAASTVAGALTGVGILIATVIAQASGTFTLTGKGILSSTISAIASGTGTLTGKGTLSSTIAGAASGNGTLTGKGALITNITAAASTTATLLGAGALSGTLSAAATASGLLRGTGALQAAILGAGAASGTLTGTAALTATIAAAGFVTGTLTGAASSGAMTATITGSSTLTATPSGIGNLVCTISVGGGSPGGGSFTYII